MRKWLRWCGHYKTTIPIINCKNVGMGSVTWGKGVGRAQLKDNVHGLIIDLHLKEEGKQTRVGRVVGKFRGFARDVARWRAGGVLLTSCRLGRPKQSVIC